MAAKKKIKFHFEIRKNSCNNLEHTFTNDDGVWTEEEILDEWFEQYFEVTEEELDKCTLTEKRNALKVLGYRIVKVTVEDL